MASSENEPTFSAVSNEMKGANNSKVESLNNVVISDIEDDSLTSSLNDGVDLNISNNNNDNITNKNTKLSCAFTIDHFESGKEPDHNAQAAKYKVMLARFQNRHRRGLSKLENATTITDNSEQSQSYGRDDLYELTMMRGRPPRIKQSDIKKSISNDVTCNENSDRTKPARVCDDSTRHLSQRHSWSPRSCARANDTDYFFQQQQNLHKIQQFEEIVPNLLKDRLKKSKIPSAVPRGRTDLLANRSYNRFIPRSTAMHREMNDVNNLCSILCSGKSGDEIGTAEQIDEAIIAVDNYNRNFDFGCDRNFDLVFEFESNDDPVQTLESPGNVDSSIVDTASETGTYTLDGDNYTEEQKDLMNIDRNDDYALTMESRQILINRFLEMNSVNSENNFAQCNNYDGDTSKIQESYIHTHCTDNSCIHCGSQKEFSNPDKHWKKDSNDVIFVPSNNHPSPNDATPHNIISSKFVVDDDCLMDVGTVTSVSASGILAKQRTLDPCPKLSNSTDLCKTQIDSSEYVSNASKFQHSVFSPKEGNLNKDLAVTDYQKACYGLNNFDIFNSHDGKSTTNSLKNSECFSNHCIPSDKSSVIQKRQTKRDWVLEWARKARARSLSRSNINNGNNREYDDGCSKQVEDAVNSSPVTLKSRNQSFNILHDVPKNRQNSSSTTQFQEPSRSISALDFQYKRNNSDCSNSILGATALEEKHTPLRTLILRNSSDYRTDNGYNILYNNDDDYVRHTESAILSLQRNIANQNFLQSPTLSHSTTASSSPQTAAAPNTANMSYIYSVENNSNYNPQKPKTSCDRDSLLLLSSSSSSLLQGASSPCMSSSINEQQLQLLTSGEYLQRQMQHHQRRKSSLDGDGQIWFGNDCSLSSQRCRLPHATPKLLKTQPATLSKSSSTFLKRFDDNYSELDQSNLINSGVICRSNSYSAHLKSDTTTTPLPCNTIIANSMPVNATNKIKKTRGSPHYMRNLMRTDTNLCGEYGMSAVQKSASSTNFDQIYCNLDDNEYYLQHADEIQKNNNDYIDDYGSEESEICKKKGLLMQEFETDATTFYMNTNNGRNDLIQYCQQHEEENDDNDIVLENYSVYDNQLQRHHYTPEESSERPNLLLTNTRCNKALLMRIERSKQKINCTGGSMACPNTPEFSRRNDIHNNSSRNHLHNSSLRQSMPRDTSLNRLAQQVPKSLASAKKQLLKTAATVVPRSGSLTQQQQRGPQSRYLNISKYKSAQSNQFLRKDESKSTLKTTNAGIGGNSTGGAGCPTRVDVLRSSTRSSRSLSAVNTNWNCNINNTNVSQNVTCPGNSSSGYTNRSQSANRRDLSVSKQKELELALWKRRAKYDPMKAAAEDRKRKEEAKRLTQIPNHYINEKLSSDMQNNLVITQSNHERVDNLALENL